MLLPIHIAAGGLAMVLGAVALLVKKGGTIHRRSGLLFVYAMLVMGTTASILGFRKSPTDGNVFGGLMTVYFVGTALTTVRPVSPWTRAYQCCRADGRGRTRARRHRRRREGLQQPSAVSSTASRSLMHLLHRRRHDPGGDWRRAHHAIRRASRRAAPGAPSVANVLRAVHRGRIVLLDP